MTDIKSSGTPSHHVTQKLKSSLGKIAERILAFVPDDEFVEAYKEIFLDLEFTSEDTRDRPLSGSSIEAKKLRSNLKNTVLEGMNQEIEFVIEDENLNEKFVKLDELKGNFCYLTEAKKAWRPPGNTEMHMKPFNLSVKLDKKEELLRRVNAQREKLNILIARVEGRRKKINNQNSIIEEKLHNLTDDIKATNINTGRTA